MSIYKLETTKLDRFLPFSKRAKEVLKIGFGPDQMVTTELPVKNFKSALKRIVSRIYIKNEIGTRSTINEVFDQEILNICIEDSRGIGLENSDRTYSEQSDQTGFEKSDRINQKQHDGTGFGQSYIRGKGKATG